MIEIIINKTSKEPTMISSISRLNWTKWKNKIHHYGSKSIIKLKS